MNASQLPTSTPAFKRKIRFGTIDVGSGSDSESDSDSNDNLEAPPTNQQDVPDYYDPVYFDSDEEDESEADEAANDKGHGGGDDDQDDDEKEYDIRAGLTSSLNDSSAAAAAGSSSSQMSDITKKLEASSMGESAKSTKKKSKKHATISDADLLYDPDEDDRDENWLIKKISGEWTKDQTTTRSHSIQQITYAGASNASSPTGQLTETTYILVFNSKSAAWMSTGGYLD